MAEYTQSGRWLSIETPLGKDAFLLTALRGYEEVSGLFRFEVDLLSEKEDIDPVQLMGEPVSVKIELLAGGERYVHGHVETFTHLGKGDRLDRYHCEIVPWFWFLTNNRDCRIFQEMTVPDIITKVLGERGFTDYSLKLRGSHPQREYIVQYRESDFDFLSRLMEEEGIYYWFKHEAGKHTMIIGDSKECFEDCAENEVRFPSTDAINILADDLTDWQHRYQYRPGKCSYRDYNFKTPNDNLEASEQTTVDFKNAKKLDVYDYPGRYTAVGEGRDLVRLRMQGEESPHDLVEGRGKCRSFHAGGKFKIVEHRVDSEVDKEWHLLRVEHRVEMSGVYVSGGDHEKIEYRNDFVCMPADQEYRPPLATRKPYVRGGQTAVVVGPSGQEIYCDKYGRIKVQFHWDREGKKDQDSSCWMRVVWPTAGSGWGTVAIPRIGHEVMVHFLEGDPDRPVVAGSLYNEVNMPPLTSEGRKGRSASSIEDNRMILTIRTNSLNDTGGYNEISMDDTSGEEVFYIRAQYDQFHEVLHDRDDHVGNDEKIEVGNDRTEKVGHDEKVEIVNDRTHDIGNDDALNVVNNQKIDVQSNRSISVGGNQDISITGNLDESVTGNASQSVTGNRDASVTGNETVDVTGQVKISGMMVSVEAMTTMELKCGASKIMLTPAMIQIQSPILKLN